MDDVSEDLDRLRSGVFPPVLEVVPPAPPFVRDLEEETEEAFNGADEEFKGSDLKCKFNRALFSTLSCRYKQK